MHDSSGSPYDADSMYLFYLIKSQDGVYLAAYYPFTLFIQTCNTIHCVMYCYCRMDSTGVRVQTPNRLAWCHPTLWRELTKVQNRLWVCIIHCCTMLLVQEMAQEGDTSYHQGGVCYNTLMKNQKMTPTQRKAPQVKHQPTTSLSIIIYL